jgi:hypothetical protein
LLVSAWQKGEFSQMSGLTMNAYFDVRINEMSPEGPRMPIASLPFRDQ